MHQRLGAIVVSAALLGLALTGCGSDPQIRVNGAPVPVTRPGSLDLSTVTFVDSTGESAPEVDAIDNVFKAKFIEVRPGTPITFRNDGRNTHNLIPAVEDEFAPVEGRDFEPGAETTLTFDAPGDYPFYCSLHGTETKGMNGAIRVTAP